MFSRKEVSRTTGLCRTMGGGGGIERTGIQGTYRNNNTQCFDRD